MTSLLRYISCYARVRRAWTDIEKWLAVHSPAILESLYDGATEHDILPPFPFEHNNTSPFLSFLSLSIVIILLILLSCYSKGSSLRFGMLFTYPFIFLLLFIMLHDMKVFMMGKIDHVL